jgi:DnaD/phage-associated family protein
MEVAYHNSIGSLTPVITDMLGAAGKLYTPAWVVDALAEAAKNNKRSWAYAEAILKRWKAEGRGKGKRRDKGLTKEQKEAKIAKFMGLTVQEFREQQQEAA